MPETSSLASPPAPGDVPNLGKRSLLVTLLLTASAAPLAGLLSLLPAWLSPPPSASATQDMLRPEDRALFGDELLRVRRLPGGAQLHSVLWLDDTLRVRLRVEGVGGGELEILRRDPAEPPGPLDTPSLHLLPLLRGAPTLAEPLQRAMRELRDVLAERERRGVKAPPLPTLQERAQQRTSR